MLDRASSFDDRATVSLLKKRFIPVAIDSWYEDRRDDEVGEFYREIVFQREGIKKGRTTQGFYIFTPAGKLLRGWNNRDPGKLQRLLKETGDRLSKGDLPEGRGSEESATDEGSEVGSEAGEAAEQPRQADSRYERKPPEGGLVLNVYSRILSGRWEGDDRWDKIFQSATGVDHLWVTKAEHEALVAGELPDGLVTRIARFHLVDNTRGEPPMWRADEVVGTEVRLIKNTEVSRMAGEVELLTEDESRGYRAALLGEIEVRDGAIQRFDLVVRGDFHGEGRYTPDAPEGVFELGVAFTLAKTDWDREVPPQGARSLRDYLGR